ncbi:MAG: secretion protein F [Alkaliphilus sp.]|nr:MAG: secretion protein F [Alkaliphilus sp.]
MIQLIMLFVCSLALGVYLILADILRLPTRRVTKVILSVDKREKKKIRNFEVFTDELSMKMSKFVRLSDYDRRKIASKLKSTDIKLSPESFIARARVKAGLTLLWLFPVFLILPILFPIVIALSVAKYFKEIKSADKKMSQKRKDIEFELTRFVSTLTEELKANRNVLRILETYKKNAGKSFRDELEITVADMKSGSYESALTRFEARIGSSSLSGVVRGLIGVIRGDDSVVYFQMLSYDLKQLQLQRLKTITMKRPGKIRKYSFAILFCFLLTYLSVMFMEVMKNINNIF